VREKWERKSENESERKGEIEGERRADSSCGERAWEEAREIGRTRSDMLHHSKESEAEESEWA
jgi:hypothetical protein